MPAGVGSCETPKSAAHERAPVRPQTYETNSTTEEDTLSRGPKGIYGVDGKESEKEDLENMD